MLVLSNLFWWKILSELGDIAPDSWKFRENPWFEPNLLCKLQWEINGKSNFFKNFQLSGAISSSSDTFFNPNKILSISIWCIFIEYHVFEHPKPFRQKWRILESIDPPLTQDLKIPSSYEGGDLRIRLRGRVIFQIRVFAVMLESERS